MKSTEDILNAGGVAVIPTDTVYGIVGKARSPETVEKIYALRKRDTDKPCIILISSREDLSMFGIHVSFKDNAVLEKVWPGKVSVVLPCRGESLRYLHRGTNSLAFRMPADPFLQKLLASTGPLIAPSANTQGEASAHTIDEARKYFGDNVDLYIDGGKLDSLPSTLIKIEDGKPVVLRPGAVEIK